MTDLASLLPQTAAPARRKHRGHRKDSPSGKRRQRKKGKGKKVAKKVSNSNGPDWRQLWSDLSCIHTVDEVEVDFGNTLSRKHGDLHVIQGEVFKCSPRAPTLAHCPLILKKLECVDRRTYDLKVYEADTFQRFRGHPNIISLYSYWSEPSHSNYVYKTLVLMYEEGVSGDLKNLVVNHKQRVNGWRPDTRTALRYMCDIAKGLIALHNCKFIHARVKPSSVYMDSKNTCMLGEMGKVELDSARHTHHFFSKLLIGEAIPRVLVYWAPELLKLEKYGTAVDLWALGVTMYELITGQHPFPVNDEMKFREAVLTGAVDWSLLEDYEELENIIRNLIRPDPKDRWTAHEVLTFAQMKFAVEVQRVWRGYRCRRLLMFERECAIRIQSTVRSKMQKDLYQRQRMQEKLNVAFGKFQAKFLSYLSHMKYRIMRRAALEAQKRMKTYLAVKWYYKVRAQRQALETRCRDMQLMMERYEKEAEDFYGAFPSRVIPMRMRYLSSFETWQMAMDAAQEAAVASSGGAIEPVRRSRLKQSLTKLNVVEAENKQLKTKITELEEKGKTAQLEEVALKEKLGQKYDDYHPMVQRLKQKLERLAQMCKDSVELPLELAHQYTYSNWDMVHEPDNVADNVFTETSTQWKTLSPNIDLALAGGNMACFVAQVDICAGDCGPSTVIVHTSRNGNEWMKHGDFTCNAGPGEWQSFPLQGEPICSFLRIEMPNNIRGGSYVSVQQVRVRGLVQSGGGVGGGIRRPSTGRGVAVGMGASAVRMHSNNFMEGVPGSVSARVASPSTGDSGVGILGDNLAVRNMVEVPKKAGDTSWKYTAAPPEGGQFTLLDRSYLASRGPARTLLNQSTE